MSEPTRVLSAQQLLRAVWRRVKAAEHRVGIVEDRVARRVGILERRVGFLEDALSDTHRIGMAHGFVIKEVSERQKDISTMAALVWWLGALWCLWRYRR